MASGTTLNLVLFLPLVAAMVLAFLPREQRGLIQWGAFLASAATFLLSVLLLLGFRADDNATYQFLTAAPWVPQFGIQYKVGADGISLVLVLLTTLLSAVAIFFSFDRVQERAKEYFLFLLMLETAIVGCFVALDLILFYVFWELMLIPMYFLIGIWGGPRRQYATIKFVLYTLAGSLLMLVSIVWVYMASGSTGQPGTFDLEALTNPQGVLVAGGAVPENVRMWLFLGFAAAFAIKVPLFPLHTWQADAYEESPTAGTFMLAAVLPKVGAYGFARFCIPLFPDVALKVAPWFLLLAVIGIIYGAIIAYTQTDMKRLLAYSSLSHLGFVVLGLFAFTREGVNGSVLQMVNHGLSTGALFLIVGMLTERRQTREISQFGGLWKVLPVFGLLFLISMFASIGLPLLNGFVGEFLILLGTWGAPGSPGATDGILPQLPWLSNLLSAISYPGASQLFAAFAATGVILGAIYMLWMFQRVMQGPLDREENRKLKDLSLGEVLTLAPLVLLMFWLGVMPNPTLRLFDQAVNKTVIQPVLMARMREQTGRQGAARPAAPTTEMAEVPSARNTAALDQPAPMAATGSGVGMR